jgi:uncharacterized protein (UPF0332 family)
MTGAVSAEVARAGRVLAVAKAAVGIDPDSAADRAYYSAFHAFTALFAQRNQFFTRHATLHNAIHRDLVLTGMLPVEIGQDFDRLMDLRNMGDYGGEDGVSREEAELAVAAAERILNRVLTFLQGA